MEGLTLYNAQLKDLQSKAKNLASDAIPLNELFEEEEVLLNRKEEVSRLNDLCSSILREIDSVRDMESKDCYIQSVDEAIGVWGKLAMGIALKSMIKDKKLQAASRQVLTTSGGKRPSFGTISVCIGQNGIPDEVKVISISLLSRQSGMEESKVVNELKRHGHVLLNKKDFTVLIENLIGDIQEGKLTLPICLEKLLEHYLPVEPVTSIKKARIRPVTSRSGLP